MRICLHYPDQFINDVLLQPLSLQSGSRFSPPYVALAKVDLLLSTGFVICCPRSRSPFSFVVRALEMCFRLILSRE